jgi:hypothetical protein
MKDLKLKNKTPLNIIKDIKQLKSNPSLLKTPLYIALIIYLIVISYISGIIYYLNNLKKCDCFKNSNINLTYLIVIESIILALNVITALFLIVIVFSFNNSISGGGNNNAKIYLMIIAVINILILGYFIYNVYKLSKELDENCECSTSWLRYLLYIQTVFMLFSIGTSLYALFRLCM